MQYSVGVSVHIYFLCLMTVSLIEGFCGSLAKWEIYVNAGPRSHIPRKAHSRRKNGTVKGASCRHVSLRFSSRLGIPCVPSCTSQMATQVWPSGLARFWKYDTVSRKTITKGALAMPIGVVELRKAYGRALAVLHA